MLNDVLDHSIAWPSDDQFQEYKSKFKSLQQKGFGEIVASMDGTHFQVPRPCVEPQQRAFYSGKKKKHTAAMLMVVLLTGLPIFISSLYPGSENDQGLWNHSQLHKRFIGKSYGIICDGIFVFNRKRDKKNQPSPSHGKV